MKGTLTGCNGLWKFTSIIYTALWFMQFLVYFNISKDQKKVDILQYILN